MRDKHVFLLYISSSSLKKSLTHAYGLTLTSFFIKIMMGDYKTCPVITLESFFSDFWRYDAALPEANFTFWKFITCLSLLAKQIVNWVVLILIVQNIILKTRNQDFPPSKIQYVITLLKWSVRLILFLFLVVYRSTSKVILTIFRILFYKKPF